MKKVLLALVVLLVLVVSGSAQAGTNKTSIVWFSFGYESVSVLEDCYRSSNYSYGYDRNDEGYLAKMGYFALGPMLCFPINRKLELSAGALALFGGRRFDDHRDYNYEYSYHDYDYYDYDRYADEPPSYPYGYAIFGSLGIGLVQDTFYIGVRGRYASVYREINDCYRYGEESTWVSESSLGPMLRLQGGNFAIEGGFLLSSDVDATDVYLSVEFGL